MLPFVGFGGFYFAKLSTGTASNLPALSYQAQGDRFDLVLEGGIGLSVGLGKTFKKGILSAGLTVTLVGIIEGTVAWYRPGDAPPPVLTWPTRSATHWPTWTTPPKSKPWP